MLLYSVIVSVSFVNSRTISPSSFSTIKTSSGFTIDSIIIVRNCDKVSENISLRAESGVFLLRTKTESTLPGNSLYNPATCKLFISVPFRGTHQTAPVLQTNFKHFTIIDTRNLQEIHVRHQHGILILRIFNQLQRQQMPTRHTRPHTAATYPQMLTEKGGEKQRHVQDKFLLVVRTVRVRHCQIYSLHRVKVGVSGTQSYPKLDSSGRCC